MDCIHELHDLVEEYIGESFGKALDIMGDDECQKGSAKLKEVVFNSNMDHNSKAIVYQHIVSSMESFYHKGFYDGMDFATKLFEKES